jgi:hypothetical protein
MWGRFKITIQTAALMALAGLPPQALAQSVSGWSLPEPEDTATARAPGPVDAQNPVVLQPQPESGPSSAPPVSASPSPRPTITPLPTITPPPTIAPPAPRAATAAAPADRPTTAPPEPAASPAAIPAEPEAPAAPAGETATPQPSVAQAPDSSGPQWWWALAAALAAGAGFLGLFLFRRRAPQTPAWEGEALEQPEREAAEPDASPSPPAALGPIPAPSFTPPAAAPGGTIAVALEPVSIRLSLFYATLRYRIALTASEARAPLTLLGDLISAHASLSQDEQLAPSPRDLPQLHALPGLAPGETALLTGEIQLPLPDIRALHRGGGAFFVPLMRICLIGEDGTALRRVFTIGLPGSGAGLAPLRIDTGPRSFEPLAAREIEAARRLPLKTGTLPLDPQRAAG